MLLDWIPETESYILRVPREEKSRVPELMEGHGLDFSTKASSADEAVLFTKVPYAACAFSENATERALHNLKPLLTEIERSWKNEINQTQDTEIVVPKDKTLWPFQVCGVQYAYGRQHSLIGDQPGLGKTAQAVAFCNAVRARTVLVVCPANIRLQWQRMIREWSTMEGRYIIYPVMGSKTGVHPKANWTIISYDLARSPRFLETLMRRHYDVLILDEAHYLKTPSAQRTRAIFGQEARGRERISGLSDCTDRILALTGTPLPNRPRECYTLAHSLCPEAIDWISDRAFQQRFNPSNMWREAVGRLPELQARLRANFMVRRMKRDVMKQLPGVRYEILHMEETSEVHKALEAEKLLDIDPEHLEGIDAEILGHIAEVRRMMGIALAPLVAEYVQMLLEGGEEKIFVVGWHLDVLTILQDHLNRYGLVRVDGSSSAFRRQRAVDDFIGDRDCRVFLGNIQSVGIGVDGLQKVCSRIVFAECDWVPGNNQQAVDRLDRPGQEESVLADFCVARGSLSERVIGSALRKLKNIDAALDKDHF